MAEHSLQSYVRLALVFVNMLQEIREALEISRMMRMTSSAPRRCSPLFLVSII